MANMTTAEILTGIKNWVNNKLSNTGGTGLADRVAALESIIDADSDGVINKINEIMAFFENIDDDSTLEGILEGLSSQYAKLTNSEQIITAKNFLAVKTEGVGGRFQGDAFIGSQVVSPIIQSGTAESNPLTVPNGSGRAEDDVLALRSDIPDLSGAANKVSGAVANNFASLDAVGDLQDSGVSPSSFATAAQGELASRLIISPVSVTEVLDETQPNRTANMQMLRNHITGSHKFGYVLLPVTHNVYEEAAVLGCVESVGSYFYMYFFYNNKYVRLELDSVNHDTVTQYDLSLIPNSLQAVTPAQFAEIFN